MPQITACPEPEALERFLLGKITHEESELMTTHLHHCGRCLEQATELSPEDTIVRSLRRSVIIPNPFEESVIEQIQAEVETQWGSSRADTRKTGEIRNVASDGSDPLANAPGHQGVLGRYRILEVLGKGGMGEVWLAEDTVLRRRVAIKTIRAEASTDEGLRQRFLREAQSMASIEHPHMVKIYEVSLDAPVPYIVMELLSGEGLDQRLNRGATFTPEQTIRIGRQMAEGLAAANEKGFIHRDIKPSNVWLESPHDQIKLLDFGLARTVLADQQLTQTGMLLGTPAYLSPERADGLEAEARDDLFSLGCTLYQMLTGKSVSPFQQDSLKATLNAVTGDQPVSPHQLRPEVPRELSDLVMKLLAKKRADRPSSAQEVIAELLGLEQQTLIASIPTPTPPEKPRLSRRRLLMVTGILSAAVLLSLVWDPTPVPPSPEKEPEPLRLIGRIGEVRTRHFGQISHVAISGDRKWVVTWGQDGYLQVADTDKLLIKKRYYAAESPQVSALAISQDGSQIAWATGWVGKNAIHVMNVGTGKIQVVTQPHAANVVHLRFSSDGKHLVSGSEDKTVACWNLSDVKKVWASKRLPTPSLSLVLSPDGKQIFSGHGQTTKEQGKPDKQLDCVVRRWSLSDGTVDQLFEGAGPVTQLTFSPKGKLLTAQQIPGKLRVELRDPKTGDSLGGLLENDGIITAMEYVTDGKHLLTTRWVQGAGPQLEVHSLKERQNVRRKTMKSASPVVVLDDSTVLYCAEYAVMKYDWRENKERRPLKGPTRIVRGLKFSRDGKELISVGEDGVRIWGLKTFQQVSKFTRHPFAHWVILSDDGQRIVTGSEKPGAGNALYVWNYPERKYVTAHKPSTGSATFVDRSGTTVALTNQGGVCLLNVGEGMSKAVGPAQKFRENIYDLTLSSTRDELVLMGKQSVIWWNIKKKQVVREWSVPDKRIGSCIVAAPGGKVYVGFDDGTILGLTPNADKVKVDDPLRHHRSRVFALAVSPDGKRLVSGGTSGIVVLWDADRDGAPVKLHRQQQKDTIPYSLDISPDGKLLAIGNENATIEIYQLGGE